MTVSRRQRGLCLAFIVLQRFRGSRLPIHFYLFHILLSRELC